jgi:transcriptional regulator with GAF, ATPase, and Fis domain
MIEVSRELADQIAEAAELLADDDDSDPTLHRLTRLAVELVPGGAAAALTVEGHQRALTFAASDPRIEQLHDLQFESGHGPVVEAMRHNEPRNVDDMSAETRWPPFCRAAADVGFASCLMLPLRTDRRPAGAVSLFGESKSAFRGTSHDLALLFAAQGGTAVHNANIYQQCCEMVSNLHIALESRAVIEQAKGILHAAFGLSTDDAFRLLNRRSQSTNRKVREIAADVVSGEFSRGQFGPA